MKTDNILKQHDLADGLKAVVTDVTRHYFGGYYHVRMLVTALLPVKPACFASSNLFDDAFVHLGSEVQFSRILEKMAVPESEIESVRQGLMNSFEENLLPYMSRADFGSCYVNSEYQKALKNCLKAKSRHRNG